MNAVMNWLFPWVSETVKGKERRFDSEIAMLRAESEIRQARFDAEKYSEIEALMEKVASTGKAQFVGVYMAEENLRPDKENSPNDD